MMQHLDRKASIVAAAAMALSVLALAGFAHAQGTQIKPYMLIIFDTSGSMAFDVDDVNTRGDGTRDPWGSRWCCPGIDMDGDTLANDSRLYMAKEAMRQMVAASGDITFGLMKFPQTFYASGYTADWYLYNQDGSTYDELRYNGACSSTTIGNYLVVWFGEESSNSVYMWMNQTEYEGINDPITGEYELRADGGTPLGWTIGRAEAYFAGTTPFSSSNGVIPNDSARDCRPYFSIILTDGDESCGGAPASAVDSLYDITYGGHTYHVRSYVIGLAYGSTALNQMADYGDDGLLNGSTPTAYRADTEEELSAILFDIIEDSVLVEICDGDDDDCDTLIDEGFTKYCDRHNVLGLGATTSLIRCEDPGETICDGLDDNCQYGIDEGLLNDCGTCGTLTEICNGIDDDCDTLADEGGVCGSCIPTGEICDNADNDCDTIADDNLTRPCGTDVGDCVAGTQTCTAGTWGSCVGEIAPAVETCNNEDDDCNGVIDGYSVQCELSPGVGDTGECEYGYTICTAAVWSPCTGGVGPVDEVCNGLDDDCDGTADDGNPGGGAACGTDVGECVAGVAQCLGGSLVCVGATPAAGEVCDGLDNDCDGVVDDGNPGGGADCGPAGLDGIGVCRVGVEMCTGGVVQCVGGIWPGTEACNGLDDDCDGSADEGDPGGGISCGSDVGECVAGVQHCVGGVIVCQGEVGANMEICNGLDDDCDGTADDGNPGGGAACGSDTGECVAGTLTCMGGALVCFGEVDPTAEVCNTRDDDCDGSADEGNPGGGADCGPVALDGIGICEAGTITCTAGVLVCTGAVNPVAEVCNGLDDDCDGTADEGNPGGGAPCGTSTGECVAGTNQCMGGTIVCVGEVGPGFEVCNGLDDDCDGTADDGNPGGGASCGTSTGECSPGTLTCTSGSLICTGGVVPVAEICNTLDDDCDGSADEGNPGGGAACGPVALDGIGICEAGTATCVSGGITCVGAVWPGVEVCNGIDDDCDGSADEGDPGGGGTCGTDTGDCVAGVEHCIGGVLACIGEVGPGFEVCDGHDNDCDGSVDEGNPGGGASCGSTVGECTMGILTCTAGSLVCAGAVTPTAELCDTLDNDCDGTADEGNPEGGAACGPVSLDGIGICRAGTETCTAGALVCVGATPPGTEACNGLDDDCDGTADDGNPGGGALCGTDAGECTAGVMQCVGGTIACIGEVGPGFEVCDALDNDCDGSIDEGNPGGGAPCGTDTGECTAGIVTCTAGAFVCAGEVPPATELCNGLDDDCDGSADEGNPEGGTPCGPVALDGVGICEAGVTQCVTTGPGTASVECIGAVDPGVEICNGIDDDCSGVADDGDPGGGASCGSDTGECVAGTEHCVGGSVTCVGDVGPSADLCDGLDNDCDGTADEGDPGGGAACGMDIGECVSGTVHCIGGALVCDGSTAPSTELCNGLDDDCDGTVDDGNPEGGTLCGPVALDGIGICEAGVQNCVTVGPGVASVECIGAVWPAAAEDCNGLDDDCNHLVDDGIAGGAACGTDVGECTSGHRECVVGIWLCVGEVGPEDELCDGLDNDCDDETDEGNPGGGENCGTDVGECEPGVTYCDTDLVPPSIVCQGERGPADEVCDGLDNDCNHLVDDGLPLGEACGTDVGECSFGNYICLDGEIVCAYGVGPGTEVCDGLDNDCDGEADNEAECPGESICVEGYCASPCNPDEEWPCASGRVCEEVEDEGYYCIGDPCEGVVCEEDERCSGGTCVSLCDMIECPSGQVCVVVGGVPSCIPADCYAPGWECEDGERCAAGECEPDPCYDVVCGTFQFCREGECFDSCTEDVVCPQGEVCYDGECVEDPCFDVECSYGLVCDPDTGTCADDPCAGVDCRDPLVCVDGDCVDDPCSYITCPDGFECQEGTCIDDDLVIEPEPDQPTDAGTDADDPVRILATGAGGCAGCTVTGAGTGASGPLALILVLALGLVVTLGRGIRRTFPFVLTAALLALALAGCNEVPWCLDNCDQGDATADVDPDGTGDGAVDPDTLSDTPGDTAVDYDVPDVCNPEADELCNGADDDCDTLIDEGFDLDNDQNNCGSCGNRCELPHAYVRCIEGECVIDPERGCDVNFYDCVADDPADLETMGCDTYCIRTRDDDSHCDGYDNDCDCEVDEDIDLATDVDNCGVCGRSCRYYNAEPTCVSTTGLAEDAECVMGPCDPGYHDLDEDPNTGCEYECNLCQRTEGACETGLTCCTPGGDETCDGMDDDCDGDIDEDDPGGDVPCGSDIGECSVGVLHCVGGSLACQGDVGPGPETCNGLDDDCDLGTDEPDEGETLLPDEGLNCGESMGDCERGLTVCVDGAIDCEGETGPVAEICDGHDNDCNGLIDDGSIAGLGTLCGDDTGECVAGVVTCVAGVPVCLGLVEPRSEVCNGLDDDCNGSVDDSVPGAGTVCGSDVGSCTTGTMQCVGATLICQGEVRAVTEVCNGLDDDCDGLPDDGNPGGGAACGIDTGECRSGTMLCVAGVMVCQGDIGDTPEICDGLDNDCNGLTDDGAIPGMGASCGSDTGECVAGVMTCVGGLAVCVGEVGPRLELCNGLDDDCDATVDDSVPGTGTACGYDTGECVSGTMQCVAGVMTCQGATGPVAEACNSLDDDCDGSSDEGDPGGGALCGTSVGECVAGTEHCVSGSVVCQGAVAGSADVCNGLDDDCDGTIDDGDPGGGASCGTNVGECVAGTEHCVSGSVECVGDVGPTPELCDTLDNDCNGSTDEGTPGAGTPCGIATGECSAGTMQCVAGVMICQGAVGPMPELCDTLDNDCDGSSDEGDPGGGAACGSDTGECVSGRMHCVSGAVVCQGMVEGTAEVCDGLDNDCDGVTDEGNPGGGGACGSDIGDCVSGTETCVAGLITCVGEVAPSIELCDTRDNDCDGSVDEGTPGAGSLCGTDTGQCVAGTMQCVGGTMVCQGATGPVPESCNLLDDDCDGSSDEGDPGGGPSCGTGTGECVAGTIHCVSGVLTCQGAVAGTPEVCDGLDNDCDGTADEGNPGGGAACGTDTGQCVSGTLTCMGGSLTCLGNVGPVAESCNTLDDDCDGTVDEGTPGSGTSCGSDTGQCVTGTMQCVSGAMVCQGAVGPSSELCDTLDNDCDGTADEGNPGGGASCGIGTGECSAGVETCVAGAITCVGSVGPTPETCDGLDNDCDGTPDDGDPGSGASCGSDVGDCVAGTMHCLGGALQCVGDIGPTPETCDTHDNDCDGSTDEDYLFQIDPTNCGSCDHDCAAEVSAHAIYTCSAGSCRVVGCDLNWWPGPSQGCTSGSSCCTYYCEYSGNEVCDGLDNDCDQLVDTADPGLVTVSNFCEQLGACNGSSPQCTSCGGSTGWFCNYGPSVSLAADCRTINPESGTCDNLDNDCDGTADEQFPLKGTGCTAGIGACLDTGFYVCKTDGSGVECSATAGSGSAELCNGTDDDCNGTVDDFAYNAWSTIGAVNVNGQYIFQHEASRPNAASCDPGTERYDSGTGLLISKACSRTGVRPWTNVSWTDAQQACMNLGSGWDLCTAAQWQDICETSSNYAYPYGNTYQANTCNGNDYDTNCPCGGTCPSGDNDEILNTGSLSGCCSNWGGTCVYDMSGNVKEWTSTWRLSKDTDGDTVLDDLYEVRGGASNQHAIGLTCSFDFTIAVDYFTFLNLSFRCCHP